MTADEFVEALKQIRCDHPNAEQDAMLRAWQGIQQRPEPAFDHPPDPILDLLARYDLSGVTFWQLKFDSGVLAQWGTAWQIATKATSDYYVDTDGVWSMYYKEAYPSPTGVTSARFLDLVILYAQLIADVPAECAPHVLDAMLADYAQRALQISPHARALDWFGEARAEFRARDLPAPLVVKLTLPGTLKRDVVGYRISEPRPDVNPDDFVLRFLRKAAGYVVPRWTRSTRRFDETCVWSRGEYGSEDICDETARIGTMAQHIHLRRHYREPEEELFPTERCEFRRYTVCGLPEGLRLIVQIDREWRAGRLICAEATCDAIVQAARCQTIEDLFRRAFEGRI